jgi:predicted nuclease with TOPRIM domain
MSMMDCNKCGLRVNAGWHGTRCLGSKANKEIISQLYVDPRVEELEEKLKRAVEAYATLVHKITVGQMELNNIRLEAKFWQSFMENRNAHLENEILQLQTEVNRLHWSDNMHIDRTRRSGRRYKPY